VCGDVPSCCVHAAGLHYELGRAIGIVDAHKINLMRRERSVDQGIGLAGKSVQDVCALTLDEARYFFLEMNPGKTKEDFERDVLDPLERCQTNISGLSAARQFEEALRLNKIPGSLIAPMAIAIAYSFEALNMADRYRIEDAWRLVAEARFYMAYVYASSSLLRDVPAIQKHQRKLQAKAAAKEKNEKIYGPLKLMVGDLVIRLMPPNGWPSRRQAAIGIRDHLKKEKKLSPLSVTQAQVTIDGWLSELPNAKELFPRQGTPKP
jgi:hypothetical protein